MKPGVRNRCLVDQGSYIHSTRCLSAPQHPAGVCRRGAPAESEEEPSLSTLFPASRVALGTSWQHARLSQARSATLEEGCVFQKFYSVSRVPGEERG